MAEQLVSIISGGGTTMEHNALAIRDERIPGIEYAGVIATNRDKALPGIQRALDLEIPVAICDQELFRKPDGKLNRKGFGELMNRQIESFGGTLVMQNGSTAKTPNVVIENFPGRIYNQHPGWPDITPNVKGKQPHAMMLEYVDRTGRNEGTRVVIHRVTPVMDGGAIVGYKEVPILPDDTPESLQQRGLDFEYELQEEILGRLGRGEVLEDLAPEPFFLQPDEMYMIPEATLHARERYPEG